MIAELVDPSLLPLVVAQLRSHLDRGFTSRRDERRNREAGLPAETATGRASQLTHTGEAIAAEVLQLS